VRFEVLTATTVKIVFLDMTPRSIEDIYRRFGEMFWLYLEGRRVEMMEICSCETSAHRSMQRDIPESSNFYIMQDLKFPQRWLQGDTSYGMKHRVVR
jgi:hypothetical protein